MYEQNEFTEVNEALYEWFLTAVGIYGSFNGRRGTALRRRLCRVNQVQCTQIFWEERLPEILNRKKAENIQNKMLLASTSRQRSQRHAWLVRWVKKGITVALIMNAVGEKETAIVIWKYKSLFRTSDKRRHR